MNMLDQFISTQFPVKPVLNSSYEKLAAPGTRFLVSANGIMREEKRDWGYFRVPFITSENRKLPFASLDDAVEICAVPHMLFIQFAEHALICLPNECAAGFIFNRLDQTWRIEFYTANVATSSEVDFDIPSLCINEVLVVDIHSHGYHPAYFSSKDNKDDKAGVKVAAVLSFANGRTVDQSKIIFRACVEGVFIPLLPSIENQSVNFRKKTV